MIGTVSSGGGGYAITSDEDCGLVRNGVDSGFVQRVDATTLKIEAAYRVPRVRPGSGAANGQQSGSASR